MNYDGKIDSDDWSLFFLGDAEQTGSLPTDGGDDEEDMTAANEMLAQKEAEFSGESNDEIRSQLESQLGSDAMIIPAPEPAAFAFVAALPLLGRRRRRK